MTPGELAKRGLLKNGRFAPGQRPAGRKKGTPNKATADIKAWFIAAAEAIGSDGKGKGGGRGFIEKVGRNKPEALLLALARLIPPPKQDDNSAPSITVVQVGGVPAGHYLTAEQMKALNPELLIIEGKVNDEDAA